MRSRLNLASKTYVNRRALYLLYAGVTAVVLLILITQLHYLVQMQNQGRLLKERISEIQQQLGISAESAEKYTEEQLTQLLEQIEFSNKLIIRDSFQWTGLLGQLEAVLPDNVRIVDIRPVFKDSTLGLTAQAKTVRDMRAFIDRLNESADFSNVLLLSQSEQPADGKTRSEEVVVMFNLSVRGALQ
jgi:type IV pilus assembly protein PilN